MLQLCELHVYCIAEFVSITMQNEDGNVNLVKPLSDSNCVMKVSIYLYVTLVYYEIADSKYLSKLNRYIQNIYIVSSRWESTKQ